MASLLTKEIEEEVGIKPNAGLLDQPGQLDNNIIIDDLVPDYLILDQIDYDYPSKNAYITFMTKGCTRTCSFYEVFLKLSLHIESMCLQFQKWNI